MILHLKAKAGSKLNQIIKDGDGNWVMKVKAPPVDGKANDEVIRFLSEVLNLSKSKIRIVSGHTNRFKTLAIDEQTDAEVNKALESASLKTLNSLL